MGEMRRVPADAGANAGHLTSQPVGGALVRLLALLFPDRCLGCRRRGAMVCAACQPTIPTIVGDQCPRCANPLVRPGACRGCARWPLSLDGARAACRFEGIARKAVHDLKYRGIRGRATWLAGLVVRAVERRPLAVDLLVPVPLADGRLRQRGFNQSELIAHHVGECLGVPVERRALGRVRETPPQVGRSAEERRENMAGAFACTEREVVKGRRVAVVDDVMTTGSTLEACAEALRTAGAQRVYGIVVAREL